MAEKAVADISSVRLPGSGTAVAGPTSYSIPEIPVRCMSGELTVEIRVE